MKAIAAFPRHLNDGLFVTANWVLPKSAFPAPGSTLGGPIRFSGSRHRW